MCCMRILRQLAFCVFARVPVLRTPTTTDAPAHALPKRLQSPVHQVEDVADTTTGPEGRRKGAGHHKRDDRRGVCVCV